MSVGTEPPLVGRQAAHAAASELMARPVRLVSLWGPPGIGKTRLARALASDVGPTVFVPLEGTHGLDGLDAAVVPELEQRSEGWVVLDSLEHLLEDEQDGPAVVPRIRAWLSDTPPSVSFLVTSRRRLLCPEEHPVALRPLDPEHSIELFTWLVQRRRPDFDPQREDPQALRELVQVLDGLPLALELAAARWELLGTRGLLDRMAEPLAVLARPGSDAHRHATLRQAIAWSWQLLDARQQRALQALTRFRRRFSVDDAEAMIGATALECLESLRDNALLQVPEPGRFELLASIRAFAREQTPEAVGAQLAEAHVRWLLGRYPDAEVSPPGAEAAPDLQAAARVLIDDGDGRAGHALRLLSAAAPGYHLELLDHAVDRLRSPEAHLARAFAHRYRENQDAALADVAAGIAAGADDATRTMLLNLKGSVISRGGDEPAAIAVYEEALACAQRAGMAHLAAIVTGNLGVCDGHLGRFESAELRFEEALVGLREAGDTRREATVRVNQAQMWQAQGLMAAAESAGRAARSLAVRTGQPRTKAVSESNLGLLLHEVGRLDEARSLYEEAGSYLDTSPFGRIRALNLARLSAVCAMQGDALVAREALDTAARVAARTQNPRTNAIVTLFGAFVAHAEGRDDEVQRCLAQAGDVPWAAPDARAAIRILRRMASSPEAALEVGDDWFSLPGNDKVTLARHGSLLRMFHALVEAHEAPHERTLDVDDLFTAGWPGTTIHTASARNRVHVNLAKLRSLGLRDTLLRNDAGYRLDPTLPIRRA